MIKFLLLNLVLSCLFPLISSTDAVESLSSVDKVRQISNEIMSTISSLAFSGAHSIRSQSVQGPLSYFIFLNIDYPSNYGQFASANFGSSRLPNPFNNIGNGDSAADDSRVESVNLYLENQTLLANAGYSVLFLGVCILLIPLNDILLAAVIKTKGKDGEPKWYHKLLTRSSVSFRWSFLINQFVSKYQDLAFFSFLGIYNSRGNADTLNLVVCVIGFLLVISGLIGIFFIIRYITKKLAEEEKQTYPDKKNNFLARTFVLYKELNKDRLMTMLYPFFLMLRVFGFSFVTIFLSKQTVIQLVFLNLCTVLMVVYLIKYRPFKTKGQLLMTLAYEINAFVALLGVTLLKIYNATGATNENTQRIFGYVIIAANIAMMILNFISFYLEIHSFIILLNAKDKTNSGKLKFNKVAPQGSFKISIQHVSASPTSPSMKETSPNTPSANYNGERPESPFLANISQIQPSLLTFDSPLETRKNSVRQRLSKIRAHVRQSTQTPVELIDFNGEKIMIT